MDWQQAVMMSRQGIAVRATEQGQIVRMDARGIAVVYGEACIREAQSAEWVGCDDWSSLDEVREVRATGVPQKMQGRSGIEMVRQVRRRLHDNAGDEETTVEITEGYVFVLETLAAFAVVFWMNVANERYPLEMRKDAGLKHAETWLAEFVQYL